VSVHGVFQLRLRLLRGDLETSGLLSGRSVQRSGLGEALARGLTRGRKGCVHRRRTGAGQRRRQRGHVLLALHPRPIFRDLAGSYQHMGSTQASTELLRRNWWANHEAHPVNTALGIAVGAVGLFYALKQRSVFVQIGRWLRALRLAQRPVEFRAQVARPGLRLAPDQRAGLARVPGRVHVPGLVFGALYALRSDQPGLSRLLSVLLAVIAIFAAVTNGLFIVTLISTIRRLFADSVAYERTRILAALRDAEIPTARRRRRGAGPALLLTEGTNLADVPNYPISGRWLRFLGVVPAFLGALVDIRQRGRPCLRHLNRRCPKSIQPPRITARTTCPPTQPSSVSWLSTSTRRSAAAGAASPAPRRRRGHLAAARGGRSVDHLDPAAAGRGGTTDAIRPSGSQSPSSWMTWSWSTCRGSANRRTCSATFAPSTWPPSSARY